MAYKTTKDAGAESREDADLFREIRKLAGAMLDVDRVDEITEMGNELTTSLKGDD